MPGVYLLKAPYDGIDMLKIGFSKNILKRIKSHISSNPFLEVIGWIETEDYKRLEKQIHWKCRTFRYKNTEWFRYKEAITDFFTGHKDFKTL
jgi:hypothetical protein